jgi:hypothetical protein
MWFPVVRYIWTIKMRDGRAGLLPATSLSPDANQPPMRNRFETGGRRGACLQALAELPLLEGRVSALSCGYRITASR